MQRNFETIAGHTIVCGYGRNGRQTVKELLGHNKTVVVIDNDKEVLKELENYPNAFFVVGDVTTDDVLQMANVPGAAALITTLPKDADNLFVVISARVFNRNIPIVSRASVVKSQRKLISAGANYVIMPDHLGGFRMAQLVVQPDIVEFIDYILLQEVEEVNLEEISCKQGSCLFVDKTIGELNVRNRTGANILGIRTFDNQFVLNPNPDFRLKNACHVFALGNPEQINALKKLILENVVLKQ